MKDLHITCETRDTAVWVHGVTWCDKIKYRDTRFGNSTGLPAPVLHPRSIPCNLYTLITSNHLLNHTWVLLPHWIFCQLLEQHLSLDCV